MSISWLVLELRQYSFIKDWPKIWKSEIPPSEFCPKFGEWGDLGIPNLARMFLIKCSWMLENTRVTDFTVSKLLGENQQREWIYPPRLPRLGLRCQADYLGYQSYTLLRMVVAWTHHQFLKTETFHISNKFIEGLVSICWISLLLYTVHYNR